MTDNTVLEWVKISDRLPDDRNEINKHKAFKRFLVTDGYDMWVDVLHDNATSTFELATHWMPLPELPNAR